MSEFKRIYDRLIEARKPRHKFNHEQVVTEIGNLFTNADMVIEKKDKKLLILRKKCAILLVTSLIALIALSMGV